VSEHSYHCCNPHRVKTLNKEGNKLSDRGTEEERIVFEERRKEGKEKTGEVIRKKCTQKQGNY
jgi:hypothetical protein